MQGNKNLNPLNRIAKANEKLAQEGISPIPATGVNVYFWEEAARAPQPTPKCNLTAQELLDTIADCLMNNVNCSIYSLITNGNIKVTLLNSIIILDGTCTKILIVDATANLEIVITVSEHVFKVVFNNNTFYSGINLNFNKINAFTSSIIENLHIS